MTKFTFALPLLLGSAITAQIPGAFSAAGNIVTPRYHHTATLLPNGKVLLTGGSSTFAGNPTLASAELYDPSTRIFSATANMSVPRASHTVTLLPSGKVLIAGGQSGNSGPSAELYDPDAGTFTATGAMITPRLFHTATLLNSGKVLIAGGLGQSGASAGISLSSAELYDPATGTFTATGGMHEPDCDTATLLPNGKVLITRGVYYDPVSDSDILVPHAELYDPSNGTFAFTGDMVTLQVGPTATLLMNGQVLIAGGDNGQLLIAGSASASAELYDPATGKFASTGSLAQARENHTAALLPDGTVLMAGGDVVWDLDATAEVYDPVKGAFGPVFSPKGGTSREVHSATLLSDGGVVIAGGYQGFLPHNLLSNAEIYTPAAPVPAPVLFSLSGDGQGQGAIWHAATGVIASTQNPAVAGEVLAMYTTSLFEGGLIPPQVAIGGQLAEILYFGDAPGYLGYFQVNFRVPAGVVPGPAVPLRLIYIGRPSNRVTIGAQ